MYVLIIDIILQYNLVRTLDILIIDFISDQDSVRLLAVEGCAALGKLLEPQDCVAHILPVIVNFSQVYHVDNLCSPLLLTSLRYTMWIIYAANLKFLFLCKRRIISLWRF